MSARECLLIMLCRGCRVDVDMWSIKMERIADRWGEYGRKTKKGNKTKELFCLLSLLLEDSRLQ